MDSIKYGVDEKPAKNPMLYIKQGKIRKFFLNGSDSWKAVFYIMHGQYYFHLLTAEPGTPEHIILSHLINLDTRGDEEQQGNYGAEFGVIQKPCFFCANPRTVKFAEHYTFCPECSAIYTHSTVLVSHCEHIPETHQAGSPPTPPEVIRQCWFKSKRDRAGAHIIEVEGRQTCSCCGAGCIADGW